MAAIAFEKVKEPQSGNGGWREMGILKGQITPNVGGALYKSCLPTEHRNPGSVGVGLYLQNSAIVLAAKHS